MSRNARRFIAMLFWLGLAQAAPGMDAQSATSAGPQKPPFRCRRTSEHGNFSGYQVTEENDSIIKLGGDERYTQGLRIAINFHRDAVPCIAQRAGHWLQTRVPEPGAYDTGLSLVLGHTLYTPNVITSRTLDPQDRGFADFTYVSAELSLTKNSRSARHLFDVAIGALGHEGLAKGAQGGLHTLKMARIPKGWYSTEPNTVGVNLRQRFERRVFCDDLKDNCPFDATGGYVGELGNVRTALGLHTTLRAGWGLTGFPAAAIPTAAGAKERRRFELGALVGVEGRGIAHTNLVQETPGSTGFSVENFVGDFRWGFYGRWGSLRATYQHIRRSAEFSIAGVPKRSQDFASISLSYEPRTVSTASTATPTPPTADAASEPEKKLCFCPLKHWQLELGMGTNFAGPRLDTGDPRGITAQIVARKGLGYGFNLGLFELSSATVEGAPTPGQPGDHSDIFLRQRAVTLGWGTELNKVGSVAVRAGTALWGGNARIQTIFHPRVAGRRTEDIRNQDFKAPRGGWLVGAQYLLPLERHLSVGVDVSYHSVKLGAVSEPRPPGLVEPRYLQVLLLAQIRP